MTADISIESVSIFGHLMHDIGQKNSVNTYDVCFQLDNLKGRLNLAVLTRERLVIAKLDGWPEVGYYLEIQFDRIINMLSINIIL